LRRRAWLVTLFDMTIPSQPPLTSCTHERRPGTTVCLHCRHEARLAAQARLRRLLLRGSAVAVVVGIFGVAGMLSAGALRNRSAKSPDSVVHLASVTPAAQAKTDTQATPTTPAVVTQQGDVTHRAAERVAAMLPAGETSFGDGVTATRVDSTVLVAFDTPMMRTRMPEKFERFVRATLPRIYGAVADSALAHVPAGSLAQTQQELLYELPTRGVHIALRDGRHIAIYPEIRPGQDGPLVVRYRVSIASPN